MTDRKRRVSAVLLAGALLATTTGAAMAQTMPDRSAAACQAYENGYASRNATGSGHIRGIIAGGAGGAVLGGIVAGPAAVGTWALVGAGAGLAASAHSPYRSHALRSAAFRRCMSGKLGFYGRLPTPGPSWFGH